MKDLSQKNKIRGIGLMSGTSMDGLDIACCDFWMEGDSYQYEIIRCGQYEFDEKWKTRISHLYGQSGEVFAKTHVYFGHWLGEKVQAFIKEFDLRPDFVASHGQTIYHQPDKSFTAQIGDGETLVSYLDCPVITNFRNKDIAMGGEGAPLVPLGEHFLYRNHSLFLNLGGFANLGFDRKGFDVCACNIVLNLLANRMDSSLDYDPEGCISEGGSCQASLFKELNELVYFSAEPPKSLGWEWVEAEVLPLLDQSGLSLQDQMRTFTEHVCFQISRALSLADMSDSSLLVTGGGKHNTFLMKKLGEKLAAQRISVSEETDQQMVDFKEAIIFAFLGLRILEGKSTTWSSITGSKVDTLSGSIHLPASGGYKLIKLA
ncbi:MAG: anhydro-N-acetylmuramic acid kinase [Bacteroidota bacterium]